MSSPISPVRPLHLLPALALAWTLALLIAPALASAACSGATTNTFTGAPGGDWGTAANWTAADGVTHAVPVSSDHVCVPASTAVVVNGAAGANGIEVEGALTVNSSLSIGSDPGSRVAGTVQVAGGGSLALAGNTLYDGGALAVDGTLVVSADLQIDNGLDITGAGTIDNSGTLRVTTSTGANHTTFSAALNNNGLVSNQGPVDVLGGGSGNGSWKLGSGAGPDEPVVTIGTTPFQMNGDFTDVDSGGLGHLVVDDTTLTMVNILAQYPRIDVYQLDLNAGAGLDLSPIPVGTSSVSADVLNIANAGGLFEVDAPLTVSQMMTMRDGAALLNGATNINTFHWGGGDIQSSNASTLTVQGLDMSTDGSDSGARSAGGNAIIEMAGAAYATPTYSGAGSTFTLNGATVFRVGPDAQFSFGDDVDIALGGSATARVVNDGIINKVSGAPTTGSRIGPPLTTANGELWVGSGTALVLDVPPDTYDAGTNTLTGTYVLDGELVIPGAVSAFAGQWQLGAGGTITQTLGGTDIFSTLAENGASSTITVFNPISFAQNFLNSGVVDIKAGGSVSVTAGKTYSQTPGATTKLSDPASQLLVPGGMTLGGGTLSGVGTVFGDVTNSGGTVSPGNSPGTLTITGDFTQNGAGVFMEEIDGPGPGQFDKLQVTGTATLGGSLVIGSTNGYQAPDGQRFQIVDAAGGVVGTWGGIVQPPSAPYFEQVYAPNTMVLSANSVSIGDATVNEGSDAVFTISLGQASPAPVSVDWATQDGTAAAGTDYGSGSGTVDFAPGETAKTVAIAVSADGRDEPSENFAVNLSNPVNTRIRDANGVGTIGATATAAQVVAPGDIDGFAIAPPPVQGKAVNVEPVKGTVLVKLPGKTTFVALPDAEQVPVGTIVDARKGTVRLFSVGTRGRLQSALFYDGVFQVLQGAGQALTQAKLTGGSFAGCPKPKRAGAAARRKRSSSVRRLWGSGSGQFRTAGRYASATIRGTRWLTDDRCDGTLVRVAVGAVTVRDLTRNRTVVLKQPQSYLAPAKRR